MEKKKILLIEDELYILDLYKYALTNAGFEVVTALDGYGALELIKNTTKEPSFNLILLDIMLPKMNGIEFLKKLRENEISSKIPIVLITNLGAEEVIKQAFKLGAVGYLLKANFTPFDIVEQVKKFISDPNFKMDVNKLDLD